MYVCVCVFGIMNTTVEVAEQQQKLSKGLHIGSQILPEASSENV